MSTRKPILFDVDDAAPADPAAAPPLPDDAPAPPRSQAMARAATLAGRPRSRLARAAWAALGALVALALSVAAWDFATALVQRSPALGWLATGLMAVVALGLVALALRELAGFRRLRRIDALRAQAATTDLRMARDVSDRIATLYADRPELLWARERLAEGTANAFDADGVLALTETTLLAPIDQAARAEVEAAARQVALITAVVPMAALDVAVALLTNLRMIRRIAALYGGRSGTLGSLRLLRAVLAHLLATGLVSAGDDLIGSVAGGGMLSKLSRRFGEGVMNGALTARVGVATIEVCRPLPFAAAPRPRVTALIQRALTGLFDRTPPTRPEAP
ncbi:TIGR01620 family protein [Rhodobacteraceae bacterium 2376]|uniref:TIGR01620 family protein n=1 Tax=Rhabdonatronobacter sediminivivens TaxID=2743469 RepID=A0A7Z0HZ35_9RHOB|nr:TIGR01620 family protein [Rhabdonatronobacter sediminivivens]NYS24942.1 TIGR01620 family protein [Rhabdonatronobacter sediminivivens]